MGRRKQPRPHHSVGTLSREAAGLVSKDQTEDIITSSDELGGTIDKLLYVEVDRTTWDSCEHLDISEVLLSNLSFSPGISNFSYDGSFYQDSKHSLRFRLSNLPQFSNCTKLGRWPLLSASDIRLELMENSIVDDTETVLEIFSGNLDGPDEGISSLVHLVNMKFFTLRPVLGCEVSDGMQSIRLRVEILKSAFEVCGSLLDNTRELWKRSMMNVMAWLRPEVMTSEARYGSSLSIDTGNDLHGKTVNNLTIPGKPTGFDAAGFYEAIKPSKDDPQLEDELLDLIPELRPYQRRAVLWMVQREKGASGYVSESSRSQILSPLCMPVNLIDTCSTIFYNPFSGSVSLHQEYDVSHVFGGILADEMGLGKTVELIACIFAHRKTTSETDNLLVTKKPVASYQRINLKRLKRERVECICGAVSENSRYKGLWVQCDICDAWQHADCVDYSSKETLSKHREVSSGQKYKEKSAGSKRKRARKKNEPEIALTDGEHICQMCSELIQATEDPVTTGATLIVCPAPILSQWYAEIIRHTRPGSLKTCIYEGVRSASLQNVYAVDMSALLNADVVLTTYDVLKEDLSHDSDRHDGDRRNMRFQKRVCLDEAQMVESSVAAATEMAMRLHCKFSWCITGTPIQRKLDDLYGLLRFLKASPYDVLRWWVDVIRDPYEKGDTGAMAFTHKLFKQIMWRSSKLHVADELQIPPQEECLTWITLSPIEEHFYQRQHETCLTYACEVIRNLKDDILKQEVTGSSPNDASNPLITHVEAEKLLNSLLKLRQACCHPQVGGSGLRALQKSPMTMEEILSVLVGKTKVEGEEALRKSVVAMNALAAISIIKEDFVQAALLYKESLGLAEEQSESFRLDPLLEIHIRHNLAEILPLISGYSKELDVNGQLPKKCSKILNESMISKLDKLAGEDALGSAANANTSINPVSALADGDRDKETKDNLTAFTSDECLIMTCENLKHKFLSVFNTKLTLAQQEFRKSYTQVSDAFNDRKNIDMVWWLEALDHIELNKDLESELIRKIGEAVSSSLNTSRTSKIASCFRSITALKYYIQTGLDSLEASRKTLLDRLLEIDNTLSNPKREDVERVRYCPVCQPNGDGCLCVHCELDELFQVYEARLFRLKNMHNGGAITSAEEAVGLQKKKSALNRFYWNLSRTDKSTPNVLEEDTIGKRDVGEKVLVLKSSSEVEIAIGIIRSIARTFLDGKHMEVATKQLLLLEGMRKEYATARSLAIAQAQVLRAHDEIAMAISRLRLRTNDDDNSIDALSSEELVAASVEYSGEKFLAVASISRIKGQLRYLEGLVQSQQKHVNTSCNPSEDTASSLTSTIETDNKCAAKDDQDTCPICQDKLSSRKMVFQCGHVTCCRCLFAMTEKRLAHPGKFEDRWIMCPTCRQRTDYGNIAYADDDGKNEPSSSSIQDREDSEASITVQGSYSTKIEAVTRRILWIHAKHAEEKVLVFSSWNDVLDVLEHAFSANSISYIRMKGGRKADAAISNFRGQRVIAKGRSNTHEKKIQTNSFEVLLLLIQHGANGLNLLEAQHVILAEPLLNPAAEAQAISRVHRIGQHKKTLVHRFIVKNTVEESIYKLNSSRSRSSFISGNTKNQDQPILTLKDVESLFAVVPSVGPEMEEKATRGLSHLPPSVAAALAAEKRLMDQSKNNQFDQNESF
ncbi:E3 ubiquitin-protein ligase SHPRH isoform X2 [Impatiens glandulifera]|uniref:E3 ubiquitin-protein ligase SHPRH isoform X2 n=1 Tax=Impatiens glandulifera TaxID=253017 RepID=UPI001FB07A21|nr:E3 ubiquitin-protein ligase SHPRH isoform X2 [Impatiens glandulifera]